jgi:hypothetical protein
MMHPRRREWLVFDDRGNVWPAHSPELRRELFCDLPDDDLRTGVIRNLGFVAGTTIGSNVAIRLHPGLVSEVALAATFYWLADRNPERVLIDYVGTPSHPAEVCTSAGAAIGRLVKLTGDQAFSRYVTEKPCPPDRLPAGSPLRGLLELWAASGGRYEAGAYSEYAARRLLKRFLIVRHDGSGRLVFDTVGDGLHVPDREWFRTAIGRPIEEQPDTRYWRWVAQIQRAALRSDRPVLSDIDASIYWPSLGRVRRRYRRMLLPCVGPDGSRLLFSANSAERGISLRGEVA